MKGIQRRTRYAPDVHAKLEGFPRSNHNMIVNTALRNLFEIVDVESLLNEIEKTEQDRSLIQQSLRTSWGAEVDRESIESLVKKLEKFIRA